MTSSSNDNMIRNHYDSIKQGDYLQSLIKETGINITDVYSGVQPLITGFTHSDEGIQKDFFYDRNGKLLALPGGHGQCFLVLKEIFNKLYSRGIRYISIGNVDNIGYTLDPKTLALLAITEKNAIFDFSFKTKFDIKGGILITDQNNRLNCTDLGVSVSKKDIENTISKDVPILFNCATGMFNLKYLIDNIDKIINKLPTRFTDQKKDIGKYSQAEQITWEVISLLEDFSVLAVDKYSRFLASKLLVENLMTSGIPFASNDDELKEYSSLLNKGLEEKLKSDYKLELKNGRWS